MTSGYDFVMDDNLEARDPLEALNSKMLDDAARFDGLASSARERGYEALALEMKAKADIVRGYARKLSDARQWAWEEEHGEPDLSECAYFRGRGICSFGCHEEPRCQTSEPSEGWPAMQVLGEVARVIALLSDIPIAEAGTIAEQLWGRDLLAPRLLTPLSREV